jgi:hypothetical protein
MFDIFNRELRLGDLVLPMNNNVTMSNVHKKLGLVVGENQIFFKREKKPVGEVISIKNCVLVDPNECGVLSVKEDLGIEYSKYVQTLIIAQHSLSELGPGLVFNTDDADSFARSWVYLGHLNVQRTHQRYYSCNLNISKYLYVSYTELLRLYVKDRSKNIKSGYKKDMLGKDIDMRIYYNAVFLNNYNLDILSSTLINRRDIPLSIGHIHGTLNLLNRTCDSIINSGYESLTLKIVDLEEE